MTPSCLSSPEPYPLGREEHPGRHAEDDSPVGSRPDTRDRRRCAGRRPDAAHHRRSHDEDVHQARRRAAEDAAQHGAVPGDAARGHRAALPQRVLGQPSGRHLRRRRLGRAAVQLARQVRLGDGLAELHPAARRRPRRDARRPHALHAAHRGALQGGGLAPGPRVRRRPRPDRPCATASTRRRCGSSRSTSWKPRDTASTASCSTPRPRRRSTSDRAPARSVHRRARPPAYGAA